MCSCLCFDVCCFFAVFRFFAMLWFHRWTRTGCSHGKSIFTDRFSSSVRPRRWTFRYDAYMCTRTLTYKVTVCLKTRYTFMSWYLSVLRFCDFCDFGVFRGIFCGVVNSSSRTKIIKKYRIPTVLPTASWRSLDLASVIVMLWFRPRPKIYTCVLQRIVFDSIASAGFKSDFATIQKLGVLLCRLCFVLLLLLVCVFGIFCVFFCWARRAHSDVCMHVLTAFSSWFGLADSSFSSSLVLTLIPLPRLRSRVPLARPGCCT